MISPNTDVRPKPSILVGVLQKHHEIRLFGWLFSKVDVGLEVPGQKVRILRDDREGNGPLAFHVDAAIY